MPNEIDTVSATDHAYDSTADKATSAQTSRSYPRHFKRYFPAAQDYFDKVFAAGGSFNVGKASQTGVEPWEILDAHDQLFRDLDPYLGSLTSLFLFCGKTFDAIKVAAVGPDATSVTAMSAGFYNPAGDGGAGLRLGLMAGNGSGIDMSSADTHTILPASNIDTDSYESWGMFTGMSAEGFTNTFGVRYENGTLGQNAGLLNNYATKSFEWGTSNVANNGVSPQTGYFRAGYDSFVHGTPPYLEWKANDTGNYSEIAPADHFGSASAGDTVRIRFCHGTSASATGRTAFAGVAARGLDIIDDTNFKLAFNKFLAALNDPYVTPHL